MQHQVLQAGKECPPIGYLFIDIETDGLMSGSEPPPVICAASIVVLRQQIEGNIVWCVDDESRTWPVQVSSTAGLAPEIPVRAMTIDEICTLVEYMWDRSGWLQNPEHRVRVSGWNILGFDLKVLAAHCALHPDYERAVTCKTALHFMAWDCWDPMFNFLMGNGYPVSLEAVCNALPFPMSKTAHGADVAKAFLDPTCSNESRLEVIEYCRNDVVMCILASTNIAEGNPFSWITKAGNLGTWSPKSKSPEAILKHKQNMVAPVCIASTWAFPDNSWMAKGPRQPNRQIPSEIQHTAGKHLTMQHTEPDEVNSTQTVQEVTITDSANDLPNPENSISWLRTVQ